jgi:hypothetical protein
LTDLVEKLGCGEDAAGAYQSGDLNDEREER